MATATITPETNKLVKEYSSLCGISNDEATNRLVKTGFRRLMASRKYSESKAKMPRKAASKKPKKAAKKAASKKPAKKAAAKKPAKKAAAKKAATKSGRRVAKKPAGKKLTSNAVHKMIEDGYDASDIATKYGVTEAQVVKLIAKS